MSDDKTPGTSKNTKHDMSTKQIFTSNVPIPPNLETEGNLSKAWKQWRHIWDAYGTVANLKQRESSYRVATFITCIGSKTLEIHTGLPFENEAEKNNIDTVLKLWEDHCVGKINVIYERYKFNERIQKKHENIEQFVTLLRSLAETCEFSALKDDMIRDRILC
jgi:hypothetical protein